VEVNADTEGEEPVLGEVDRLMHREKAKDLSRDARN
jgi:hypothetical protein